MSLRDIENTLKELYGVKINKDQITKLISAVNEETEKWKKRKLKPMYVFTYADCLYIPIKDDLTSTKRAVYVIIGVDVDGYKDILGLWIDKTESASFWSNVFEDLKERGVRDIFMQYLEPLFELPDEIRKCIYTSNAVETVNSALRKVTRGKGAFPNESSVYKVLYLRIKELKEKWNKPIQGWKTIQCQIINLYGERYTKYLEI